MLTGTPHICIYALTTAVHSFGDVRAFLHGNGMTNNIILFSERGTDGNSDAQPVYADGLMEFQAAGTWDGATVKLQFKNVAGAWQDATDTSGNTVSMVSDSAFVVHIPVGEEVRANMASAGGSTSVTASLKRLPQR